MFNPRVSDKPSNDPLKRQGNNAMAKTVEKGRDAITGRFISIEEANRRRNTSVIEKVKVGPTKRRK